MFSRLRSTLFFFLASCAYLTCTISLFLNSGFLLPLISFVFLFLSLDFLAFDLLHVPKKWIIVSILGAMIGEMVIFGGSDWHFYLGMVFFHGMLIFMLLSQLRTLKNTLTFRPWGYFMGGSSVSAVLLTLFFSVIMLGKYSQLPFSCEDINQFPMNLLGRQFARPDTSWMQEKTPLPQRTW